MTPTPPGAGRWARAKEITAAALDGPSAERTAFVAAACAADALLMMEVESLLGAHDRAGRFMEAPAILAPGAAHIVAGAAEEAAASAAAGRRLGPYRILRELGHGGMGVVYLAERADAEYEKRVAIKVVRGAGLAGEILIDRFRAERSILAALDHPNIARLLDGGTTDDGLPYLVMEHVDGVPLDEHARATGLRPRDRLRLFRQVCAAVQYAHQRLVIHRDLKPRNILVTAEGTPKLLDFGIAKLLEPGPAAEQTVTGLRALSLEAASPEQVRGEPLAVTSDVYALGVLLFGLLSGRHPYGAEHRGETERMRAICEEDPPPPSAVAAEEDRRELRGELDWIVLKAMRKEPDRRYGSVEQLADDVGRYLDGRPVAAAPDSWTYRARKFALRNRAPVAATALIVLSLAAGVAATLWQARRAEENRARAERGFSDARRLASSVMGELHDAIEALPGATAARSLLLKRACEHLDALAADAPEDAALAEEVATAYHRLGNLQAGSTNQPNLADESAARASHRKGLALRKSLAARFPDDLEARSRLVASLIDTAYAEDQAAPALDDATAAVAGAELLRAARPGEMRFVRQVAASHYVLGAQYRAIGEMSPALRAFEAAAPMYQAIHDAAPRDADASRGLALCHKRLGAILAEMESPDAIPHLRSAVALDEATQSEHPDGPQERRDLSTSLIQLGIALQRQGDLDGAAAPFGRALALREELVREDPRNARAPRDLAVALWSVGVLDNDRRRWDDARVMLERSAVLARAAVTSTRAGGTEELRATIVRGLADSYEGSGRLREALVLRRQSLAGHRALFSGQPGMRGLRREVVLDERALGGTLARLGRWPEARDAFEEGVRVASGLGPGPLDREDAAVMADLRKGLARVDAARGRE
jgi:eukaryotic-like serine/threonine-protein kinase